MNDMNGIFSGAAMFNSDLSKWDVSSVTDVGDMFFRAKAFDGEISKWDVSRATHMFGLFSGANSFNRDISTWDVSRVADMHGMFWSATSFNSDISKWNVWIVKNMFVMFAGGTTFNSDISLWVVSSVRNMQGMFWKAASFDVDLSKWDVSNVINMDGMFQGAKSFKQTLCGTAWVLSKATKNNMFKGSFGSTSRRVCTSGISPAAMFDKRQHVSRRPVPERELIARSPIATPASMSGITSSNTITCRKRGKFKKSGRASCCAPGGDWFGNCGSAGNRNIDHRWFEGAEACKPHTAAAIISSTCPKCGTIEKSGNMLEISNGIPDHKHIISIHTTNQIQIHAG